MKKGFTLIELVFVVLLIGLMSSLVLPKVSNMMGVDLKSGANRFGGYMQNTYEQSVLQQKKLRLRIDFAQNRYWVEAYEEPTPIPLLNEETKLDEAIQTFEDREVAEEMSPEEQTELEDKNFKIIDETNLKPVSLPSDIRFKALFLTGEQSMIESGMPSIPFFPNGFSSLSIVYLANQRGDTYSVVLPPVGGRARVERGELRPEDV